MGYRTTKKGYNIKEMTILGVMGPAGCGKDTVAGLLKKYNYTRVASADAMKQDAVRYFSVQLEQIENYKDCELAITSDQMEIGSFSIRHFLQTYGMDMRDRFGDNYWIDRSVNAKIKEMGQEAKIVVTDIRFQNEIDYVRSKGGQIAYITGRSALTGEHKSHISEAMANSVDIKEKVDFIIDNSHSLDDLEKQLKTLIDKKVIK